MAEHTDNWGALTEVLAEMGSTISLLSQKPLSAEATRAYLRWMFAALEAFTFCLKRIAVEHANKKGLDLSRREREVLEMLKEPSFPGLPPPRRISIGMRESFSVAVNVYARGRDKESPLPEGVLPKIFIDTSVIHDRIAHPEKPEDLRLTKEDLVVVIEFLRWFESVRSWLYRDRTDEIQEMKVRMNESIDAMKRKLTGNDNNPSSG
jgi:hypothetical protein